MSEEWGPWIEHDGKGCPCKGMYGQWQYERPVMGELNFRSRLLPDGRTSEGFVRGGSSWFWVPKFGKIIRYRIRKPKGLTILESVLREVEREKVAS